MKIKILDMDHLGNGIGKINDKVIFVPKSIPGDECVVDVIKEYKNYSVAKIIKIIEKSDKRIDIKCPYYGDCGGCNISNLSYSDQIVFKTNKVKNIFKKYLDMEIEPSAIESNKQYCYRNKIVYHNDNVLGLVSEFDKIIDIDKCELVSDRVNLLYDKIKREDLSLVKDITIREVDNGLILGITGNMKIDNLEDSCISVYINNQCVYKKEDGYICINDIKYMISFNSFFQINTSNISNLYDEIVRYGEFKKEDIVIDLYCGVGSISLYVSKYVKEVLGIEIVTSAINDANENAKINNINNVKFLCGSVSSLIDENIYGDVIIVDPPRSGLDKHTIDVINEKKIKRLIYVSCNPMTLVRDLKLLDNYKMQKISVIDMFPQTHHVECVCLLTLKR